MHSRGSEPSSTLVARPVHLCQPMMAFSGLSLAKTRPRASSFAGQTRQFAGAPRRGGATPAARDGLRVLGHEPCREGDCFACQGPLAGPEPRGRGTARARLQRRRLRGSVGEGKRLLAFRQELSARVRVRRNHCRSRFPGARSRSGIVDMHSRCQPPVLAVGHALDRRSQAAGDSRHGTLPWGTEVAEGERDAQRRREPNRSALYH